MQAQSAARSGQTLGGRAVIELHLQDARRDLAELLERRGGLLRQADVERALACEPGRHTARHNCRAASLRLDAFLMDPDVAAAKLRVRNLESQLQSGPAQAVAPVVLESEWVAGQDDTHNYAGAAA
ncbi:MAG: hypothetical protein ACT6S0_04700 [Roseateles sp.]|uniref:hypothetical protein n=1 Tax=Roseateles sp. TaxID=1971397 RepID=UPI004036C814